MRSFLVAAWVAAATVACTVTPPYVRPCTRDLDCPVGTRCEPDAGTCTPMTPAPDAGASDADAGTPSSPDAACTFSHCTSAADCPTGTCSVERDTLLGGAQGPEGLPAGMSPPDLTVTPGGLCVPSSCDLAQAGIGAPDGCGSCGVCTDGPGGAACRPRCVPGGTCPLERYACDPVLGACVEQCKTDAECRVARRDHGEAGHFDGTHIDRLGYDAASSATCDRATGLCVQPGTAGVRVGSHCALDSECGPGQACVSPSRAWHDPNARWCAGLDCNLFEGGYCARLGCDASRPCDAGDVCVRVPRDGTPLGADGVISFCARACTVGTEADADRLGVAGHGNGCETGQACVVEQDEISREAVGACLPGRYNSITTNDVGAACSRDEQCYSPHGVGRCWRGSWLGAGPLFVSGTCTIESCDRLPPGTCGAAAECQQVAGTTRSACFARCSSASDCAANTACVDVDADATTPSVCVSTCGSDAQCRAGEHCIADERTGAARCVSGDATCAAPLDLSVIGVDVDGWSTTMPCVADGTPSDASACVGSALPVLGPWLTYTATETGTLLALGASADVTRPDTTLAVDVLGTCDELAVAGRSDCQPQSRAVPVIPDKTLLLRTPFSSICTSHGARRPVAAVRLAPARAHGASCDPFGITSRCTAPDVCTDLDGTGFRCGAPPSCSAPIDLARFLDEDGTMVWVSEVQGRGVSCTTGSDVDAAPFRFVAPANGRLLVSPWPFLPDGSQLPLPALRSRAVLANALTTLGVTHGDVCAGPGSCLMPTWEGRPAPLSVPVAAGEVIGLHAVYPVAASSSFPWIGLVARFEPNVPSGGACRRGIDVCDAAGELCSDPLGSGVPQCRPPALLGERCDPVAVGACTPGLYCGGMPATCVEGGGGSCAAPYRLDLIASTTAEGWLEVTGDRSTGTDQFLLEMCHPMYAPMLGAPDVVYRFTAPTSGMLVARTDLADVTLSSDTVIGVFRDCGTPATRLVCNDEANTEVIGGRAQLSAVRTPVLAGSTVDIVVDGWAPTTPPRFQLDVAVLPTRSLGQPCDPQMRLDACDTGLHCNPSTGTCL